MEPSVFNDLPIEASRSLIEYKVRAHRVVVIQAETGAGKSTRVPQFLLSIAPYVVVTQPRRIAAATIARRVAEEMKVELGSIVGYRTATDCKTSNETRLLFCTDGLEVMRQIFEGEQHEGAIIVIDEAHEWNLNLELLMAWFRLKLARGADLRLVIMSATIEAELLATYFDDVEVISSKGRTFPITEIKTKSDVLAATRMLLKQEYNVLTFMPGKAEIKRLVATLKRFEPQAIVLPFHADLSREEQELCFRTYDRPKCIVATNVAQTSITVPDIDAVVDGGIERRPEIVDGVEGLYIRPISLADREQRKGRAGRVRPGVYIDCCPSPLAQRSMFPKPAIVREGLECIVLSLASIGLDPEDVRFFHQPPQAHVEMARNTLQQLGCLSEEHVVTKIGKIVASLPVGIRYARMIAETYTEQKGRKYVQNDVVTLAILLEQGGILNNKSDGWKRFAAPLPKGLQSDAYNDLLAYEVAGTLALDALSSLGIDDVAYERVRDTRQRVLVALRSRGIYLHRGSSHQIHQALVAGLSDLAFKCSATGRGYKRLGSRSTFRQLPPESLVHGAEHIVGIPWNFQVITDLGSQTKRIIRGATVVSPKSDT